MIATYLKKGLLFMRQFIKKPKRNSKKCKGIPDEFRDISVEFKDVLKNFGKGNMVESSGTCCKFIRHVKRI